MLRKSLYLPLLISAALAVGACSSTGKKTSDEARDAAATSQPMTSAPYTDTIAPAPRGNEYNDAAVAAERALTNNIVYFDYDQSSIRSDYQSVVDAFARYLAANPSARVRLEGHADERGTTEYNIALGERRANAVQSALVAQGVSPSQTSVISYGEERPAVSGSSEEAYAQNRRVQIIRQ